MELGTLFVVPEVLIFSMKYSHTNKYPRSFPQTGSLVSPLFAPEGVFIEALSLMQPCLSCFIFEILPPLSTS